ncbi:uncharacterized protein LOC134600827 [Pelobates fuscus]|uniref:uncharacterized protein LOC134600827 n=1 Tax=Pelobates fuscus TaxID=191477 RepID=UPI002FE4F49C
MKILLTVFLCGLALCYAGDDTLVTCLVGAFEMSPPLADSAINLFCLYGESPEKDRDLLNGLNDAWIPVVKQLGCGVNSIANINADSTLEEITKEAVRVVDLVLRVFDGIGIGKPVLDALCHSLEGLLTSDCLKDLAGKNIPDALTNLFCKLSDPDSTMDDVIEVMKNLECTVEDTLELETALRSLTDSAAKIVTDAFKSELLDIVKADLGNIDLPLCDVPLIG